jgi:hypothetical protein
MPLVVKTITTLSSESQREFDLDCGLKAVFQILLHLQIMTIKTINKIKFAFYGVCACACIAPLVVSLHYAVGQRLKVHWKGGCVGPRAGLDDMMI